MAATRRMLEKRMLAENEQMFEEIRLARGGYQVVSESFVEESLNEESRK